MNDARLCIIEVKPQHRRGRGRYWKTGGYGYTDDVTEAGLFSRVEAERRCRGNTEGIHRVVPAERRIRPALREAEAYARRLRAMLAEAGTLPRGDRRVMDFETRAHLSELKDAKRHGGVPRAERERRRLQAEADAWNAAHPVGTPVRYWTGLREGEGQMGTLQGEPNGARLSVTKTTFVVETDDELVVAPLVDMRYPDWRLVVPRSCSRTARLPRAPLVDALRRLAPHAKRHGGGVELHLGPERATVRIVEPEGVEGEETLPVVAYTGEPLRIAFGAPLLLGIVERTPGDVIELGLNEALSPTLIRAPGDDRGYHILMPVRP